jgi:hypothetical protein
MTFDRYSATVPQLAPVRYHAPMYLHRGIFCCALCLRVLRDTAECAERCEGERAS